VHTFIDRGTRINIEIGTDEQPELIRWTSWNGGGDLQQSYVLKSSDGIIWIDPVRPKHKDALHTLNRLADGPPIAIISTTPFHERNIYWFRQNYGAPIFVPKKRASEYDGSPDHFFDNGDLLPNGVKACWVGDAQQGEMILHWQAPKGEQLLICGDAIYGQSNAGDFDGAPEDFWFQVGGIRLYGSHIGESQMRRQFESLLDLDFERIVNGHNPKAIDQDPKSALRKVLEDGAYEVSPSGANAYLWVDLREERKGF